MVQTVQVDADNPGNSQIRVCEIVRSSGSCGFNLTKSKWDPYPWVSNVDCGSPAEFAGVQAGDCLLEVNGEDVLGLRVVEVANRVKARDEKVTVMLWNSGVDPQCSPETLCCGPMPINLQRLSVCMSNIMAALECPICLDTIPAPAHQCVNGHLVCFKCRVKTDKCPVCRIKLSRGRSLLADQVYYSLIDAFDLRGQEESKRRKILKQKLFGHKNGGGKNPKPDIKINLINSTTSKILNKLMRTGKSSSAENLTTANSSEQNSNLLSAMNELHLGLKTKSLSSNEIFKMDQQSLSRTTSILSSRPGSGLLYVQPVTYSKRPASYHGSAEELYKKLSGDVRTDDSFHHLNEKSFSCPCESSCEHKVEPSLLFQHIQEYHEGPIFHFFKPLVELTIPMPFASTTVLAVSSFNSIFIIKVSDYSFKSETNRLWVWSSNNKQNFTALVTVEQKDITICSDCPVIPIQVIGWQQVIHENHGVLLSLKEGTAKLKIEIISNLGDSNDSNEFNKQLNNIKS